MNIVNFGTEERTMTSREIAELTGKRHKHVLADIEVMLDELGLSCIDFAVALPDSYGRMKPCFQLPKRETLILLTRHPSPMCQRVIDRWEAWEALETGKATPAAVPIYAIDAPNGSSSDIGSEPYSAVVEAIQVADALAKMLRLEGSARLDMAQKAVKIRAPDLLPMVPVYAINAK